MSIAYARIRIKLDTASSSPVSDQLTGATPDIWRKEDVQLEFGVFFANTLQTITDLDKVVIQLKDNSNKTGAALIDKEVLAVDFNAGLTLEQWNNITNQHFTVVFSNAETNQSLGGADSKQFWLVVGAIRTGGQRITLGTGLITIRENGWL